MSPQKEDHDRQQLRALVDSYAAAVDERDLDAFVALFVPDAALTIRQAGTSPEFRCHGHGELTAAVAPLSQYLSTMHLMANHRCEIDGDRASGETYCLAHHLREAAGGVEDLVMMIRYGDTYARTPEGWRFARREVRILWTEVHAASVRPLEFGT